MEPTLAETSTEGPECVICLERLSIEVSSTKTTVAGYSGGCLAGCDSAASPVDVSIPVSSGAVPTTDVKPSVIAEVSSISGCNHIYHDKCIKEWSLVSNSCPTCRAKFNKITVRGGVDGPILRTYNVRNRRAPAVPHPESDMDIFSSYAAPRVTSPLMLHVLFPTDTEQCAVCGSGIGELSADLAVCLCCQRSYHSHCLETDLETFHPSCPHCQTHLVTSSGNEFVEENYTHADFLEDNDTISQIFQYVSRNRGTNQQGRVTTTDGSRTSSRLRELRRVREFNETVLRIGESLFDGLSSHPDDEVLESHIVREAERESRREARTQRRRNAATIAAAATDWTGSNNFESATASSVAGAAAGRGRYSASQPRRPRLTNLLTNSLTSPPPPVRPRMSPEEVEAWNLLDVAESSNASGSSATDSSSQLPPSVPARQRSIFSPDQNSSSSNTLKRTVSSTSLDLAPVSTSNSVTTSSLGGPGQERKFKRPNSSLSSTSHRQLPLHPQRDQFLPEEPTTSSLSPVSSSPQNTACGPTTMQQLLSSIRGSVTTGNLSASSSSRPVPNASTSIIASSTSSSLHSSPTIQPVSAPASSSSSVSPQAVAASPKRRPAPSLPLPPPLSLASPSAPVAAPTSDSPARDYHIPPEDKKRIQRIVREVITKFYKAKQLEKQQCLELEPQIIKRMYRRVHKEHARMRTSSSANGSGGSESATTPVDPELAERKKIRHWKEVVQFYVDQKWRELSAVAPASGATTTTTPASA